MIPLAIDTGGTFTDCVYFGDGQIQVLKLPSTPEDPGLAVAAAVTKITGGQPADVRHGTTVGTNALLERKGARVAFVTTAGFEDTIEIGRQARAKLYDLFLTRQPPLAPRPLRFGVLERVAADGEILHPVGPSELARLQHELRRAGPESIAVSLLFSFANPANEQAVVSALRTLGVPVSASHEILPEFREYERGATVLINAYLAPKMQSYLQRLDDTLRGSGSRLQVMQSSGGIIPAAVAAQEPVRTILSGPAGGVVGARAVARAAGYRRILTFDMGGTSTDVALLDTEAALETSTESQMMNLPIAVPTLRIHTVGAGGGSLAGFDRGGALQVGPQSAGANPGPICYGRGLRPTVTDANLLLGRLDSDWFLGGHMKLDEARTQAYLESAKGDLRDVESFADGIIRLADVHMERALRHISVESGYDPREFALVSFGGAGPLHACALARALQIPTVLIPMMPGALSAYGILVSDVVRDYSRTVMLSPQNPSLPQHLRHLEQQGAAEMQAQGFTPIALWTADLRYAGQGYELSVPWSDEIVNNFHRLHERRYGYSDIQRAVEVVNVRVRMIAASAPLPEPESKPVSSAGDGHQAVIKRKPVFCDGEWQTGTVYQRDLLAPGDQFPGPAVVVEYSATTFLPADCTARVDHLNNLVIAVPGASPSP